MIVLQQVAVKFEGRVALFVSDLKIEQEDSILLTGLSGSGKTIFAKAILGQVFHGGIIDKNPQLKIGWVPQQHPFRNLSNVQDFYYQQRFQSQDAEDAPTLQYLLNQQFSSSTLSTSSWLADLHLLPLLDKPLIQLSNGENKRAQIALALYENPQLLILDSPFIGLDIEGRATLTQILGRIKRSGVQILLTGDDRDIPEWISHVVYLEGGIASEKKSVSDYKSKHAAVSLENLALPEIESEPAHYAFSEAVSFKNIRVSYGANTIVENISWTVKKGSRWTLRGANGAGKSTLLSLITGDHPQAYANQIYLFDKKRGSGESIWDIKKKIGYVSPELHVYFSKVCTCLETIGSGIFDTIGLFKRLTEEQDLLVRQWLKVFQLEAVADKPLYLLSLSQQRLALLARALIKNPPLLILDEPCQGLDSNQTTFFNAVIDQLCKDPEKTLIYVTHYSDQLPGCVTREKLL